MTLSWNKSNITKIKILLHGQLVDYHMVKGLSPAAAGNKKKGRENDTMTIFKKTSYNYFTYNIN
jgi:hypothetical protein